MKNIAIAFIGMTSLTLPSASDALHFKKRLTRASGAPQPPSCRPPRPVGGTEKQEKKGGGFAFVGACFRCLEKREPEKEKFDPSKWGYSTHQVWR
jgi:hypothetical protein